MLYPTFNNSIFRYFLILILFIGFNLKVVPVFAQNFNWAQHLKGKGKYKEQNITPGESYSKGSAVDSNGNIFTTGIINDSVNFSTSIVPDWHIGKKRDGFLAKYNAEGNLIWAHHFGVLSEGSDIAVDKDQNIVIVGHAQDPIDFDFGPHSNIKGNDSYAFIAKYTNSGTFLWVKILKSNTSIRNLDLDLHPSGRIAVTGTFKTDVIVDNSTVLTSTDLSIFIAQISPQSNILSIKSIQDISNLGGLPHIKFGKNNDLFVSGIFGGTVDFDLNSTTHYIQSQTTCDRFLARYNWSGDLLWVFPINVNEHGGLVTYRTIDLTITEDNEVLLIGNYKGKVDFDPGPDSTLLNGPLKTWSFMAKYDENGQFIWVKDFRGSSIVIQDIETDCSGNIYIVGSFIKADFDPSIVTKELTKPDGNGFTHFLAHYTQNGAYLWAQSLGNTSSGHSTCQLTIREDVQYVDGNFRQFGHFDFENIDHKVASSPLSRYNAYLAKYTVANVWNSDSTICSFEPFMVDVTTPNATYLWDDNSTDPTKMINNMGVYSVDIITNCGTTTNTFNVNEEDIYFTLGADTSFCLGDTIWITPNLSIDSLEWQNGFVGSKFPVTEDGFYSAKFNTTCGPIEANKLIELRDDCSCELYFPNAFTPNNDGLNDVFESFATCSFMSYQLTIYDRWGKQVFHSNNPQMVWDGTYKSTQVNEGVYSYILKYNFENMNVKQHSGVVLVLN